MCCTDYTVPLPARGSLVLLAASYVMAPGRRVWMGVHKLAPCARRHGYSLARAATVYIRYSMAVMCCTDYTVPLPSGTV